METLTAERARTWLSGSAASREESQRAAEIARGIHGVKAVENDIRVQ